MATVSDKLTSMINEQINAEFESAYLYLEMANFYAEKGFTGISSWFNVQAKEEVEHATKFIGYLTQEEKKVILTDIKATKIVFKDLREPLVEQLDHERLVTKLIYGLVGQAEEDKDYRSLSFLKWYVDEQTEEEEHSRNMIEHYDLIKDDVTALLKWDAELGKRE